MGTPRIQQITGEGLYLVVDEDTYFLPYTDYPWFQSAPNWAVERVEQPTPDHLYWPLLDVDLSLTGIREPWRFPLQSGQMPDIGNLTPPDEQD